MIGTTLLSLTNSVFRTILSYFTILPHEQVGAQRMIALPGIAAHLFGDGGYVSRIPVAKGNQEITIGDAD